MAGEISEDKRAEYKEAFDLFDKDRSGSIDQKELGKTLQALGANPTEEKIKEMIEEADTMNSNGKIEFEEFIVVMEKQTIDKGQEQEELREAFKIFDKDGSGAIDQGELKTILTSLGADKMTDEEFDEMWKDVDRNDDGTIDFAEFAQKMAS